VEDYLTAAYELLGFGFWEDACRILTACPVSHPMISYALAYAEGKQGHAAPALFCVREAETLTTDLCFPSRVMEKLILDYAVSILPEAAKAHYYLGELLYDKKQYAAAIGHWEPAVALLPSLAPAHKNLSIAYYNHGDRSLAAGDIAAACRLESGHSRFLLEQEQLLARLGRPVKERLALLEEQEDLLPDRYALMLAYVSLLNQAGKHEKALDLLMNYTFHVWEGGEGKVADEYKTALFALSEQSLSEGRPEAAYAYAQRTLSYPVNLGEGKLDNVPDNHAYYLMGCALRALNEEEKAAECFHLAAAGSQIPEPVRYYNDQPSDYIYYQGLAFAALGDMEKAKKSFHQLIIFGEQHLFDKVGYDFFAVSMPELEVYQDDIQKRSDDYCRRLMELGRRGLEEIRQ
jgi:tetratricopeptide (TPR) repeat protein